MKDSLDLALEGFDGVMAERNGERGYEEANVPEPPDLRPIITITTNEKEVNDAAIRALSRDQNVFKRGCVLVTTIQEDRPTERQQIKRPAGWTSIKPLEVATVRERLTATARFEAWDARSELMVAKHPPAWCAAAVVARGEWSGIRPLEGIVHAPVMRADGTILAEPGYDEATGLIYEPTCEVPEIPEMPCADEVAEMLDYLCEPLADFPFKSPEHRAAAVAAVLTPIARAAFEGPSPLYLIDGNVAGCGKGLLVNVIARIATGLDIPIMSYPENDAEMRKRISTLAIEGDPLINLDNIAGPLGFASMDAALTSTTWKDRLLSTNKSTKTIPLRAGWFATGNNVAIIGDTARRTAHIRLESREENPEERVGFRQPDLLGWVTENRGKLLAAGLTILRAYIANGHPDMKLKPWGSFMGWSGLVRNAVVWAGLPDPGISRQELRKNCDTDAAALPVILAGLEALDPSGSGISISEVVHRMGEMFAHSDIKAMREAIIAICPTRGKDFPTVDSIGRKFGKLKGRVAAGGKYLHKKEARYAEWCVKQVEESL